MKRPSSKTEESGENTAHTVPNNANNNNDNNNKNNDSKSKNNDSKSKNNDSKSKIEPCGREENQNENDDDRNDRDFCLNDRNFCQVCDDEVTLSETDVDSGALDVGAKLDIRVGGVLALVHKTDFDAGAVAVGTLAGRESVTLRNPRARRLKVPVPPTGSRPSSAHYGRPGLVSLEAIIAEYLTPSFDRLSPVNTEARARV